jgi:hypothetical protein
MDDNLLGYLLNALEPDEHRQVEEYLRTHPDATAKLERLRQALAPLAADAEPPVPSSRLVTGTFALVAENISRPRRPTPPPVSKQRPPTDWSWLRRPDRIAAALAAAILLALTGLAAGLVSTAVVHIHHHEQRVACQNNLSKWGRALAVYGDNHLNNFPSVEPGGPHGIAGVFVPLLNDSGLVTPDMSVGCPSLGLQSAVPQYSMRDLEIIYQTDPNRFQTVVPELARDYAYSLGYVQNGQLLNWRQGAGNDLYPIMADRPPFGFGNSPNHQDAGENVLYIGGNVRWCSERTVGVGGDDIYLSKNGLLEAGVDSTDTVLGPSEATPNARRCSW